MLWLAAMALTPPAPPPPDCSAGVLGDYNCDGCVDLEDRTRRISCMWGEFLTEGCCNGAETPWPGGLSDYTRISSYCLEELELPQVCEPPAGAPPTCVCLSPPPAPPEPPPPPPPGALGSTGSVHASGEKRTQSNGCVICAMPTMSAVTHTDALGYASPRKWVTADRAEQIRVMSADRAERIRGRTVAGPPKHAAPDSPRTPTAKTRPKSAPFSAPVRPRAARQMLEAAGGRGTSAFTHSPADGVQFLGRARRAEVVFTHNARALLAGEPALLTLKISAARPEDLFYVREVRQLDPRTVGSRVEVTLLRPHVTVEEKLLTLGDVRLEDGHDCAVPLRLQAVLEGRATSVQNRWIEFAGLQQPTPARPQHDEAQQRQIAELQRQLEAKERQLTEASEARAAEGDARCPHGTLEGHIQGAGPLDQAGVRVLTRCERCTRALFFLPTLEFARPEPLRCPNPD